MFVQAGYEFLAERQRPFITQNTVTRTAVAITARQDKAELRRESRFAISLFYDLVAIADRNVPQAIDSIAALPHVKRRDRVRKLMVFGKSGHSCEKLNAQPRPLRTQMLSLRERCRCLNCTCYWLFPA